MKYSDFIHMSVPGDGSCFFHSVAQILILEGPPIPLKQTMDTTNKNREKLARSLRKRCVEWLSHHLDYRIKEIGLTIEDEIKEEVNNSNKYNTVEQYLSFMRKKDAYAGQIEIYAISNLLQRNIRVYIHNKGKFSNVGLGYQINNQKNDIYLYHNLGKTKSKGLHHFEPLYLKPKLKSSINYRMNNPAAQPFRHPITPLSPKISTRKKRRSPRRTRRSTRKKRRSPRRTRRSTRRRSTRRRSTRRRSARRTRRSKRSKRTRK